MRLAAHLSVREPKKNDYFIKSGELQKNLGFIIKGMMRSYYTNDEGDEQTVSFMAEMELVTNYPALLSNHPSMFSFRCLTDTTLVILPYAAVVESYDYSHQCRARTRHCQTNNPPHAKCFAGPKIDVYQAEKRKNR
jgi:CRP-like cAMP-binding protein